MSETGTRDAAVEPTPAQWVDDFLASDRQQQEVIAKWVRGDARRSSRCLMASHEHHIERLQHEAVGLSGDVATAEERLADARVELARLRGVVEAVQALADEWEQTPSAWDCIADLRAVLAPVSSSGEGSDE